MSVRATIICEINGVAAEQKKDVAPLSDDLLLLDSGLDSLCFALLVSRLEDRLGVDPFTALEEEVILPVTFADLVRLYEEACASAGARDANLIE